MAQPEPTDYPTKIAAFLETTATRVRTLTVDRIARYVTWTAIGLIAAAAGFLAVYWLLISFFRALGTLIGQEWAYALVGGILVIVGVLLWVKRYPKDEPAKQEPHG
jgi:hypothetical protein